MVVYLQEAAAVQAPADLHVCDTLYFEPITFITFLLITSVHFSESILWHVIKTQVHNCYTDIIIDNCVYHDHEYVSNYGVLGMSNDSIIL